MAKADSARVSVRECAIESHFRALARAVQKIERRVDHSEGPNDIMNKDCGDDHTVLAPGQADEYEDQSPTYPTPGTLKSEL